MDIIPGPLILVVSIVLIISFFFVRPVMQYKPCPYKRVLVVYGKVTGACAARCIHGGGTFVVPLLQSYAYMTLELVTIDIELQSALSKKNIRVNVPFTFTIGISAVPEIMNNAAERLLGFDDVNQAKVEVAAADREGSIGSATAQREMDAEVAQQNSRSATDRKQAERDQRIEVAKLETEGVAGEANAARNREVVVAEQVALSDEGQKKAEAHQGVEIAELEAAAIKGENEPKAKMANYNAALAEREADARRRGDVALANSKRDVLLAQKEEEIALLEKQQIAQQVV